MSNSTTAPARIWVAIAANLLFAVAACTPFSSAPPGDDSLYRALGGKDGVTAIVERFLEHLADDLRIAHFFGDTNIPRLRRLLIEQFCAESGGGCVYTGDTMALSHKHLALKEADFNALVEDLQAAMDDLHVSVGDQNLLLARLAPMHGEVLSGERERHRPYLGE